MKLTLILFSKSAFLLLALALFFFAACTQQQPKEAKKQAFGMIIHGGAGTILKENMTPELESEYTAKLDEALTAGYAILKAGGTSMDAIQAAINIMEDSPLFNAGKGAVFTNDGTHELDASIMDGATLNVGAVAGVKHTKNPINLARVVMEQSEHVMMAGDGAEAFGKLHDIEMVDQPYFYTERRSKQLERAKQRESEGASAAEIIPHEDHKFGTVGAAALDQHGNLAAGTSTGGMTNKKFGRIGDAPIIGAGTYANNNSCAISATGHGEYFIRLTVARDIASLVEYKGLPIAEAGDVVIHQKLTELGGTGGVIIIDRNGNMAMPFNTAGMYRGTVDEDGTKVVKIYKE
ncbi:MAG: isoaspartyl peptidase/L-asparaginase [Deferribacteres bacterium]|nr:isoaspartyl peptidase/L-asparaginase [candidate division KSB1 bacterium]MCB9510801.1 isoaspartyl peptidase/L-asparaginase [Deferribacteres bacterium]